MEHYKHQKDNLEYPVNWLNEHSDEESPAKKESSDNGGIFGGNNITCTGGFEDDDEKGCFLTTACTLARGLPDDCLELTTLRGFRDKFLLPHKKSDVREYYDVAPDIVSAVNEKEDAKAIWNSLYQDIRHAVSLVMQGKNTEAYEHYKDMTLKLKQEYL